MDNISELTGLPELPEGYYWYIGENKRSYSIFDISEPGAYIRIIETVTIKKTVPHHHKFLFIKWTFGSHVEVEETENCVVNHMFRVTNTSEAPVFNDDDEEIGVRDVVREINVMADDLTKEIILAGAEIAYKRFVDVKKARGYLGSYPPKHLDRPETDSPIGKPKFVTFPVAKKDSK